MSKAVIEIAGLRVEREAVILERIDWRVEAGQHWVILGANGSGKTSLLSTMTGYLPLTSGEHSQRAGRGPTAKLTGAICAPVSASSAARFNN